MKKEHNHKVEFLNEGIAGLTSDPFEWPWWVSLLLASIPLWVALAVYYSK